MGVPASYVHRPEKQDAYSISSMVQYAKTHTAGVICDTLKCGEFNNLSAQQYWSIPVKNNSVIAARK